MNPINSIKVRLKNLADTIKLNTNSNLKDWSAIQVTLVVGSGRTGTGFFAKFFTENFENVMALHEPYPDLFNLGTESIRAAKKEEQVLNKILKYRFRYLKTIKESNTQHFLESNNNYTLFLHHNLKSIFPNLKIIWVVRDPKTYVQSAYSKLHRAGTTRVFDENDGRKRLNPNDFEEEKKKYNWNEMNRFQKICWHWYKYNQLCKTAKEHYGQDMIMVKYEDLFSGNFATMNSIIKFIGLNNPTQGIADKMKEKANYSDNYILEDYSNWTDDQKTFFHSTTNTLAKEFGY